MTLEEAIDQANNVAKKQRELGRDAVTDEEVHKALEDLRTARAASASKAVKKTVEKVDLDAIF